MFGVFIRALAVALALFPALVLAQSPVRSFPPGMFQNRAALDASSGGAAYTGPGDIVASATIWLGLRAYTAAYATGLGNAADIVDTATGLASCTIPLTSSGDLNLSGTICPTVSPTVSVITFCTVTHAAGCSVSKLYDQTGGGLHLTQATLASMPTFVLNCVGSTHPCINFTGGQTLTNGTGFSLSRPYSSTAVIERTSGTGYECAICSNGFNQSWLFGNGANLINFYSNGDSTVAATDNAFHSASAANSIPNGLKIYIDGALTSASGVTATYSGAIGMGSAGGSLNCTCRVNEYGVWSGDFTTNNSVINANAKTYWGF